MTEIEIQEEVGLLDLACRMIGVKLQQGGFAELPTAAQTIRVAMTKLQRLEAAKSESVIPQDQCR